jgi:hypothetical protein
MLPMRKARANQRQGETIMLRFALLLLAIVATSAAAFQPRTGHWFNPSESGTGMNIDIQDGTFVVTIYSYESDGSAQWFIASGKSTNDNHNFTGSLDKFRAGQCISCTSYVFPTANGSDGAITIAFASEVSATVSLPGGRMTQIQPFNFGFGDPPNGLLGEWVFVYDIISTFADRFDFTSIQQGTANGNGLVFDAGRSAGCELQVSGAAVGLVICADVNSAGALENGYAFTFGLDETFSGYWISPVTSSLYPMKGFKVKSKNGSAKAALVAVDDANGSAKMVQAAAAERALAEKAQAASGSSVTADAAVRASLEGIAATIRRARTSP